MATSIVDLNKQTVKGTSSADTITVNGGNNSIYTYEGNDVIRVYNGNNYIEAGAGNDYVNINAWAEAGNIVVGGAGRDNYLMVTSMIKTTHLIIDQLSTGVDGDILDFQKDYRNDFIYEYDATKYNGLITLTHKSGGVVEIRNWNSNPLGQIKFKDTTIATKDLTTSTFEPGWLVRDKGIKYNTVNLTAGNDTRTIAATEKGVILNCLDGNDTVELLGNKNKVYGGNGADSINIRGNNNYVEGCASNDVIRIYGNNNTALGGDGGDYLNLYWGADSGNVLIGGEGKDKYCITMAGSKRTSNVIDLNNASGKLDGDEISFQRDASTDYTYKIENGDLIMTHITGGVYRIKGFESNPLGKLSFTDKSFTANEIKDLFAPIGIKASTGDAVGATLTLNLNQKITTTVDEFTLLTKGYSRIPHQNDDGSYTVDVTIRDFYSVDYESEGVVAVDGAEKYNTVTGGLALAGSANNNTVTLTNVIVNDSVYGGNSHGTAANNNTVVLNNSYVSVGIFEDDNTSNIFGGKSDGVANDNKVTVNGGQVFKVTGGWASSGVKGNQLELNDMLVVDTACGGRAVNGNAEGNIIKGTNISGGYVLGGRVNTTASDEFVARDNSISLKDSNLMYAYSGDTNRGAVMNNSLTFDNSSAKYVRGGRSRTVGDATGNTVLLKNNSVAETIFGAEVRFYGNAIENRVELLGSYADVVYGGSANYDKAQRNSVFMTNSEADSVYGGYSNGSKVSGNSVTINSSKIYNEATAGRVTSMGNVENNTLTLTDSFIGDLTEKEYSLADAFGGFTSRGNAIGNTLKIENTTITNDAAAGWTGNGTASKNKLIITDSTINNNYVTEVDENGNSINDDGGYVQGGRSKSNGDVYENEVAVTNSTVHAVRGGRAQSSGEAYSNTVTVKNSSLNLVEGGRAQNGTAKDNIVNIDAGDHNVNNVRGGRSDSGAANHNSVSISSGVLQNVFGGLANGGSENGAAYDNSVVMTGGTAQRITGGGVVGKGAGNAQGNSVNLSGSAVVSEEVYGGRVVDMNNDLATGSAINNTITISGSVRVRDGVTGGYSANGNAEGNVVTVSGNAFLGGTYGDGIEGGHACWGTASDNKVTVRDSAIVNGDVIGGVSEDRADCLTAGNTVNVIGNASVFGDVIGGTYMYGSVRDNIVKIDGNAVVEGDVYGSRGFGSDEAKSIGGNRIALAGNATVKGTVFGDAGNDTITVYNSQANRVDAGAGNDLIYIGSDTSNIVSNSLIIGGLGSDKYNLNWTHAKYNTIHVESASVERRQDNLNITGIDNGQLSYYEISGSDMMVLTSGKVATNSSGYLTMSDSSAAWNIVDNFRNLKTLYVNGVAVDIASIQTQQCNGVVGMMNSMMSFSNGAVSTSSLSDYDINNHTNNSQIQIVSNK